MSLEWFTPRCVRQRTTLACALLNLALACCPVPPKASAPSLATRSEPQLGQAFESTTAFARSRYPEPGARVSVQPVAGSTWVWLVEGSAPHNRVWHLFERLPDGGVKYLLCHPAAARVEGAPKMNTDAVEFVQSFAPLAAEQRVSYEFDATRGYYAPRSCRLRVRRAPPTDAEGTAGTQLEGACRTPSSSEPFIEIPVDCEGHAGHCQ